MEDTQPERPGAPVISINFPEFKLSWGQAWKVIVVLGSLITAANASGWLFVPAKDTDLQALTQVVTVIGNAQKETSDSVRRLTEAVDNLSAIVTSRPTAAPAPPPKPRAKAAPKPQPAFPF